MTPTTVRASGETRVRPRLSMERRAIRRTPSVYWVWSLSRIPARPSGTSAPAGNRSWLPARDHAAPEPTLALAKADSLGRGRVRPLAWCSRPGSSAPLPAGTLSRCRRAGGEATPKLPAVDDRGREGGDGDPGDDVEPEMVTGRDHREPDPDRPQQPQGLQPARPHEQGEADPDHQRVGRVQARHGRIGV